MRTRLSGSSRVNVTRGTVKSRLESCHKVELNRLQKGTPTPPSGGFRLLEDGFYRLTESGDFRILE